MVDVIVFVHICISRYYARKNNLCNRVYTYIHTYIHFKRCLWCNGYCRRKWTRVPEFKSWTRLIAFHIVLILFVKGTNPIIHQPFYGYLRQVWTHKYLHTLVCNLKRQCRRWSWCHGWFFKIWTQRRKFKSWTTLFAFYFVLIHVGKTWIQ